MSNQNFSPDKMNALLKMAGKKLGQNPEDLRAAIERGDSGALLNSMDDNTKNTVQNIMSDQKALEGLMKNPQVKDLLSKLGGK